MGPQRQNCMCVEFLNCLKAFQYVCDEMSHIDRCLRLEKVSDQKGLLKNVSGKNDLEPQIVQT